MGYTSKTISLTLPKELLVMIDQLAGHELASRSEIIRQATIQYVREADIGKVEVNKAPKVEPKPARDMKKLADKYTWVLDGDTELLEFLDDSDNNKL